VTPFIESGHVVLPSTRLYPWVADLLRELSRFPRAEHDDQVDCLTQSLSRMLVWMESIARYNTDQGPVKISGGLQ
jgi:predicted phage terminase large subunit-like protein